MKYLMHALIILFCCGQSSVFSVDSNTIRSLSKRQEFYPMEQNETPYAEIYFKNSKYQFQYAINQFNSSNQKIEKRIYDKDNNLIKRIQYIYDNEGNLTKEVHISKDEGAPLEITYEGKQPVFSKKLIKSGETKLYFEYEYLYDKKRRLTQVIETISDLEDRFSPNDYLQLNTTLYAYKENNTKLIEQYSKSIAVSQNIDTDNNTQIQTQFESAEIYEYIYPNKVHRIFHIDQKKTIKECIIYEYNKNYQLRKVSVFIPNKSIEWNRFAENNLNKDFDRAYFILYLPDKKTMDRFIQRNKQRQSIKHAHAHSKSQSHSHSHSQEEANKVFPSNIILKKD